MLISKKLGTLESFAHHQKTIDYVDFEWYELNKRIAHKKSKDGKKLKLKFLNNNPNFRQGDVLAEMETSLLVVNVLPCDCIIIQPKNSYEVAAVSYEIGNQHLPLFFENDKLLVAYENPLFRYLKAMNFDVTKAHQKLLHPLKTTVVPHGDNKSLFTKIMQLTQPAS